jgi:hypothetical protein
MGSKAKMIMMACYLLSAGALITANGAIAKECYDSNKEFAGNSEIHKTNNKFLLGMVITGPLCIVCAILGILLAIKMP